MARKGLYVTPQGVAPQCSGLEIKESQTEKAKKDALGLKGLFVEGKGFCANHADATSAVLTLEALKRYQLKLYRFGLIV